eukprot:7497150-Prorocentrum_lima.AAC.1
MVLPRTTWRDRQRPLKPRLRLHLWRRLSGQGCLAIPPALLRRPSSRLSSSPTSLMYVRPGGE